MTEQLSIARLWLKNKKTKRRSSDVNLDERSFFFFVTDETKKDLFYASSENAFVCVCVCVCKGEPFPFRFEAIN